MPSMICYLDTGNVLTMGKQLFLLFLKWLAKYKLSMALGVKIISLNFDISNHISKIFWKLIHGNCHS